MARLECPAGRGVSVAAAMVLCLLVAGCRDGVPDSARWLLSFKGSTMGTYYVVKVVLEAGIADQGGLEESILPLIEAELEDVDQRMSTYRADSELSRFNAWRESSPFAASPPVLTVFEAAVELGELSGGALDITIGPLVEAWGFGPKKRASEAPSKARLAALRAVVGLAHLEVDPAAGILEKKHPELTCDLSSLAKGYAVDRVLESLSAAGYRDVLVEIGGEVRTSGHNVEDRPWRLGIEVPAGARGQVQRIVELSGEALATSGDYRNYREIDGRRVSHLIDPRDGYPVAHQLASVSVVEASCMRADALATALMVLGEEEGLALAEREGLAALFLVRRDGDFVEQPSSAFAARFMPESAEDSTS